MIGWYLVVVALASYRLTRIVTTDTLTETARDRLYHWAWVDPDEDDYAATPGESVGARGEPVPKPRQGGLRTYVNELFNCPWCLGVWVSAALFVSWRWWHWMPAHAFVVVLAIAGAQGFVASRSDA